MSEVSPPRVGASGPAPPTTESPATTIGGQEQSGAQQAKEQAQDKAQQVAGQAQDKAQQVAGQAQEKAQEAAGQAKGRAREEIDRRSTEAGEQVSTTAQDLRSVGDTLREQGKEGPAKIADQAADRAERLGGYLKDSDADRILNDVEDMARRQPWAVALGGVALGFAAARFLKASSSQRYQQRGSSGGSDLPTTGHTSPELPREGVGATGQRRFEPGTAATPPTTPPVPPATGVAGAPAGGVETPTSGVIPPGR